MKDSLKNSIDSQREGLSLFLDQLLSPSIESLQSIWPDVDAVDNYLSGVFPNLSHCKLVYAVNCHGIQYSSNIDKTGINTSKREQSLLHRPYMNRLLEPVAKDFILSPVYIDIDDHTPCITGLKIIRDKDNYKLGCIAADYHLDSLPHLNIEVKAAPSLPWQQIKGDPSIRQNLFQQERTLSEIDEHIDEVHDTITNLITQRGIFHAKIHFSSNRVTIWLYDDPCRYQLLVLDDITNPSVCLAYPSRSYPEESVVPKSKVHDVFEQFKKLRQADNTIYLRSASLNIINGMVGLTFSCDGSHYMNINEFLKKDEEFWFGVQ